MAEAMLSEFRDMGEVAEKTRQLLLHRAAIRPLSEQQRTQLDATLRHLAAVREGFQLSLRSGSADASELRAIIRYTLDTLDWDFLGELGWYLQQERQVERLGVQLMAFAHASIALSFLPLLPPSEVTHPTSSHYRDLHTPRRPGEWLERIEELEAVLTTVQSNGPRRPSSSALRRTHAYFDASAWLVREHLQRFSRD